MIRKSKYTFLFQRGGENLIYNAARNSFWSVNQNVYDFVASLSINGMDDVADLDTSENVKKLHSLGIVTTEREDESVANQIRLKNYLSAFSSDTIGVTLLPTIWCNLACPYCYEEGKPKGLMSDETCDKVLDFIKSHTKAKWLQLMWYGGEPLLGIKIIERFLSKIDTLGDIKLAGHSLVTNGTFLDSGHWPIFKQVPLSNIQITLDGNKQTHDKRRVRHDGTGTYDLIMRNMVLFANEFPEVNMSVRVNVDRNNCDEFMDVYDSVKEALPEKKNLHIYPGILHGCSMGKPGSPFLLHKETAELMNGYMRKGYPVGYPDLACRGCTATRMSGYVIGPNGELYKCWEDVGKASEVVGNIFDHKYTNPYILEDYVLKGSHVSNKECIDCKLFPICSVDCARRRLDNLLKGMHYGLCSIYKDNEDALFDMLYMYYKSKQAK